MFSEQRFNKWASFFLILFILCAATWILAQPMQAAVGQGKSSNPTNEVWYGLYTDETSYEPGDTIQIYASAPNTDTVLRLVRLGSSWTEITRTQPLNVGPQTSKVGSFIEYPALTLSGRSSFTLEGWLYPTLVGSAKITDTVVVAGQFGLTEAAAAIVILANGRVAGYVSDLPTPNPANLVVDSSPIDFESWLDTWHHLALTYDGAEVKLYIDGNEVAQKAQTGAVAAVSAPFRLGARSEAPGDLTGVIDGRLDNWTLWPAALNQTQIGTRITRGLNEVDPAPDLNIVDLYLNFEGTYLDVDDSSHNAYTGTVVNHGNPGVSGIISDTSHAFRLNHDQILDANWQVSSQITIPPNTPSGMYAIQALLGPGFPPTQEGDRLSVRTIAIRPPSNSLHSPIAVVLPTNTWNAYTSWPGIVPGRFPPEQYFYGPGFVTKRSRYPGSEIIDSAGNNSAYSVMGDGISLSYFHGRHRPSIEASPIFSDSIRGDYSIRAPGSLYLMQWLDAMGFDYDVYSDDDFDMGMITAANHRVLMPHSHHEYWSDGMLAALTQFLDGGGSVAAPAGNIFTWRVMYGENRAIEVMKWRRGPFLGVADMQSGIDESFMGGLLGTAVCNGTNDIYYGHSPHKALGVLTHATGPCDDRPFCHGQWAAKNAHHWLWQNSGIKNDDIFGQGRVPNTFALGHELDTWDTGMPLPGLASGQQAVILGEGLALRPDNGNADDLPNGSPYPDGHPMNPFPSPTTCQEVITGNNVRVDLEKAGTILYFPHTGGGHVLVIGATATPWALESDSALSGLLQRALMCFANDIGCGNNIFLPSVLRD